VAESSVTLPPETGSAICRNNRIYMLTDDNKIAGPSEELTCDDDQQAIQHAKQWLDGHDLEVWQGARVVTRLKRIA
jgi:hypothetical protein